MALSYTPTDIRGKAVEPVLEQLFFLNKTVAKGYVTFNDQIKAGTVFTEAGVTVTAQLYTGQALSSNGSLNVTDRYITPVKLEYKQTFLQEGLRTSRFNRDMAVGAWNLDSNEFATSVLNLVGPACSQDAENQFWSGILAATQASISGGSFGTTAKAVAAALTPGYVDGVFAKALWDNGTNGTGIKVTATTWSSSNIAAEFAKIYAAIPADVLEDTQSPVVIYAARNAKQLMKIANNAVGAAQQINFLFEGTGADERCYYNGVEVFFVPLPSNTAYAQRPAAVSWNTDLVDDVTRVDIGKVQNDGDLMYIRTIYTLAANIGQASKGVIYA